MNFLPFSHFSALFQGTLEFCKTGLNVESTELNLTIILFQFLQRQHFHLNPKSTSDIFSWVTSFWWWNWSSGHSHCNVPGGETQLWDGHHSVVLYFSTCVDLVGQEISAPWGQQWKHEQQWRLWFSSDAAAAGAADADSTCVVCLFYFSTSFYVFTFDLCVDVSAPLTLTTPLTSPLRFDSHQVIYSLFMKSFNMCFFLLYSIWQNIYFTSVNRTFKSYKNQKLA